MRNPWSRRTFLKTTTLAGASLTLVGSPLLERALASSGGPESLKVLILGGTGQTGPHLVSDLKAACKRRSKTAAPIAPVQNRGTPCRRPGAGQI